jgi:hypothetical protein
MDREYYFVASPGMIGVRTNAKDFKWSYGVRMPQATRADYDACTLKLHVEVSRDVAIPERTQKYHYWLGNPGEDALYYDRAFAFRSRLRLAATGLLSGEPTIKVNRTYYRYVSHRFMNLHSVGYLLTDVASMLLLHKGIAPLHCSAFRHAGATVVIAAPPNTGKTLTSMMACIEHGAEYMAEDLALTVGRDVISVPWTSTFRYYKKIEQGWGARLRNQVTRALPVVELLPLGKPKPVTEFVPTDRMASRSRISHVVLIEPGATRLRKAGIDEACRKLCNLNLYEFNFRKAPFLVAYEYFNPQLSIEMACRTEELLMRRMVQSCDQVWVASSPDPTQYAAMITQAIAGGGSVSSPERVAA